MSSQRKKRIIEEPAEDCEDDDVVLIPQPCRDNSAAAHLPVADPRTATKNRVCKPRRIADHFLSLDDHQEPNVRPGFVCGICFVEAVSSGCSAQQTFITGRASECIQTTCAFWSLATISVTIQDIINCKLQHTV